MQVHDVTRRRLFASGGLGLAAAAIQTDAASAAPPNAASRSAGPLSAGEAANLRRVQDFCRTWSAPDFDPDKVMAAYLAPQAAVRVIDSQPFVVGPAAVAAAFKPFLTHGERFAVKFLSVFARGPLVVTQRIDTQITPGQPDKAMEVVGVFLLRGGQIQEWTDYIVQ